jgi:hypothetical protein
MNHISVLRKDLQYRLVLAASQSYGIRGHIPGHSIHSSAKVAIFGSVTWCLESCNRQNWLPGHSPPTIDAHESYGGSINLAITMLIISAILHAALFDGGVAHR